MYLRDFSSYFSLSSLPQSYTIKISQFCSYHAIINILCFFFFPCIACIHSSVLSFSLLHTHAHTHIHRHIYTRVLLLGFFHDTRTCFFYFLWVRYKYSCSARPSVYARTHVYSPLIFLSAINSYARIVLVVETFILQLVYIYILLQYIVII